MYVVVIVNKVGVSQNRNNLVKITTYWPIAMTLDPLCNDGILYKFLPMSAALK